MERIEVIENIDPVLLMDHVHRYKWASSCVYGTVLDIACGIGYGSSFILSNPRVSNYIGVDIAPDAIDKAKKNYSSDVCSFHVGTIYDLYFIPDKSIDVIVTMETIEHLDQPELAMKEFHRILKTDGLLLGSVPTRSLDEHHDQYHGENQYHLTRFDFTRIKGLLNNYYDYVNIYLSQIRLCIETNSLIDITNSVSTVQFDRIRYNDEETSELGIYLFAASKCNLNDDGHWNNYLTNSSVFLGPLYFDGYAKYINLYESYIQTTKMYNDLQNHINEKIEAEHNLYEKYIQTTEMYNNLQKYYYDMEEKYQKLHSDYNNLLNITKG